MAGLRSPVSRRTPSPFTSYMHDLRLMSPRDLSLISRTSRRAEASRSHSHELERKRSPRAATARRPSASPRRARTPGRSLRRSRERTPPPAAPFTVHVHVPVTGHRCAVSLPGNATTKDLKEMMQSRTGCRIWDQVVLHNDDVLVDREMLCWCLSPGEASLGVVLVHARGLAIDVHKESQSPASGAIARWCHVALVVDGSSVPGVVGYVGLAEALGPGVWYGVICRKEVVGGHDGSVDGERYFSCKSGTGLMRRVEDLQIVPRVVPSPARAPPPKPGALPTRPSTGAPPTRPSTGAPPTRPSTAPVAPSAAGDTDHLGGEAAGKERRSSLQMMDDLLDDLSITMALQAVPEGPEEEEEEEEEEPVMLMATRVKCVPVSTAVAVHKESPSEAAPVTRADDDCGMHAAGGGAAAQYVSALADNAEVNESVEALQAWLFDHGTQPNATLKKVIEERDVLRDDYATALVRLAEAEDLHLTTVQDVSEMDVDTLRHKCASALVECEQQRRRRGAAEEELVAVAELYEAAAAELVDLREQTSFEEDEEDELDEQSVMLQGLISDVDHSLDYVHRMEGETRELRAALGRAELRIAELEGARP